MCSYGIDIFIVTTHITLITVILMSLLISLVESLFIKNVCKIAYTWDMDLVPNNLPNKTIIPQGHAPGITPRKQQILQSCYT